MKRELHRKYLSLGHWSSKQDSFEKDQDDIGGCKCNYDKVEEQYPDEMIPFNGYDDVLSPV